MAFLEDNCILDILSDGILEECHPFVCGDDDMDEFFHKDALDYTRYRMGKSYCFRLKDEDEKTERLKNPRKLRTRLMFCDLLEE